MRYHLSHCPDLSPATSRTTDRHGSKTSRIRISLCPADGGLSSFMFAIREAVIVSTSGRPSRGPLRSRTKMAWIMTLQVLHDYSDRETAGAVRFDVRWKAAIGAALDDAGFDPSTLVYWRNRIARSDRPHRVSDAAKMVVAGTGVLRGRRRRAVDSAILADALATQDTGTQLGSAVRPAAREGHS